ncbi:MAG TPA: ATP-binding protein [Candidatus Coprosoma intestinipullorum]|uniref:ATP-binding protein n=1 Tax=Candidatus Coprosoma intestinipullorum TaxID=2840752 RepID=A0A9D0ZRK2_9FIRM|nr:ATP-binding protein [Candidatus Coprosoma intestinipullorum]
MFGKIVFISDTEAHVKIAAEGGLNTNIMNMHVVFEDGDKKVLGEVEDINDEIIKIRFLGEITSGKFIGGVIRKPTFNASLRLITPEEVGMLVGEDTPSTFVLGDSPLYEGNKIRVDINDLFSSHMAIFGNSGSGKSCGVARLLQNVFSNPKLLPFRANIFIFDAYGEYHNALQNIDKVNPNLGFKFYTTNVNQTDGEILSIPLWLMDIDDMALLLRADKHSQLTIIERMLKLVTIFASEDDLSLKYQNHLIAKAIMTILYTNQTASSKRNDVFKILATCSTPQFNLEAPVQGIGYTRKFRECFTIDTHGQFPESILMTEYVTSFIDESLDTYEPKEIKYYTLEDLEKALEFTLISEGLLNNEETYADAITLKVRLHSLTISENSRYLRYPNFITMENYIATLVAKNGRKAQIINFNLEDVEDWFAKVVVKIYTKMLFNFAKKLKDRASIPFHIFVEEAHRYVQRDGDVELIGYNIFERAAKEGRKYGLMFNLISQRPVEISDTVISQCANFLIFKITHPRDLDYITKMLPNISADIVEKQKTLQPGTCMAFGSAFKIPTIVRMQMPDPAPSSSSCDVVRTWQAN